MIFKGVYKKSANPQVEELTKSCKERSYNLSALKAVTKVLEEGLKPARFCVWCGEVRLNHGNQKYCSRTCSTNAMAWAYPQKEEGLFILLVRQNWKCNVCNHDWQPLAQSIHQAMYDRGGDPFKLGEEYDWGLTKRLKSRCDKKNAPEVDHIIPIFKGGQSLGLDNHQCICYSCHKSKTSKDLTKEK